MKFKQFEYQSVWPSNLIILKRGMHMKQKIAILTDSSSSIYTLENQYENVFMVDIPCFLGDIEFKDFEKKGDLPFYQALTSFKGVPKTSQPSVGETIEMYEKIRDLGYTDIIYLPLSRELSGTYQNALVGKDMVDGINIILVNTLTTVSILSGMVLEAAKMTTEGASIEDILARVEDLKGRWNYYLTVNDLTGLVKNGRLSNAKKFVADILRIKPLIQFSQDGKLNAIQNIRTYKGAMREVVEKLVSEVDPVKGIVHVSYTNNTDDMEYIKSLLVEKLPNTKIITFSLPATVVAHVGLAAIGVGYINY